MNFVGVHILAFLFPGNDENSKIVTQDKKDKNLTLSYGKSPLHQQKCLKGKLTTQTKPQKSSITQRLRTDLGQSVGVTTAIQLCGLPVYGPNLSTPCNSRVIKRTHI